MNKKNENPEKRFRDLDELLEPIRVGGYLVGYRKGYEEGYAEAQRHLVEKGGMSNDHNKNERRTISGDA